MGPWSSATAGAETTKGFVPIRLVVGENRYAAAATASQLGFRSSREVVVTVADDLRVLALANAFAGRLGLPVLLVERNRVPDETLLELERLGATQVIAVAPDNALATSLERLSDEGLAVSMVSVVDERALSLRLATEGPRADRVVIAPSLTGDEDVIDPPGLLLASVIAGYLDAPLVLQEPGHPDDVVANLSSSVTAAYLVGRPDDFGEGSGSAYRDGGITTYPTRVAPTAEAFAEAASRFGPEGTSPVYIGEIDGLLNANVMVPTATAERGAVLLADPHNTADVATMRDALAQIDVREVNLLGSLDAFGAPFRRVVTVTVGGTIVRRKMPSPAMRTSGGDTVLLLAAAGVGLGAGIKRRRERAVATGDVVVDDDKGSGVVDETSQEHGPDDDGQ